jgi:hypothetical protein
MHFLDITDPELVALRRKFYIIVLSVAAYVATFVAYWLARSYKADLTARGV